MNDSKDTAPDVFSFRYRVDINIFVDLSAPRSLPHTLMSDIVLRKVASMRNGGSQGTGSGTDYHLTYI
jgi:hypothetical protein